MELVEFAKNFLEDIFIESRETGDYQENVFTKKMIEYLEDAGECINPKICYFQRNGMKINAYDIHYENDSIDLFISLYDNGNKLKNKTIKMIDKGFNLAEKFLIRALKGYGNKIEESEEAFDLMQTIYGYGKELKHVRIYILTNAIAPPINICNRKIKDKNIPNLYLAFYIWDIERIYQNFQNKNGKELIKINFIDEYKTSIRCLKQPDENDKYDAYILIMPGEIIADIYAELGQRLIERNVRSFLQARGDVNKGIRDTLKNEPEMFMAYNNGLSTTAKSAKFKRGSDGYIELVEVEDWQIVNGGQTTASLYEAVKNKINIQNVYIQVKLTILKNYEKANEIIPLISKYANRQTKVNVSDFSSNDEYHIALEKYSRQIWAPNLAVGKSTTKWFYERVRGQYLVEIARKKTVSEKKKFKKQNPSNQKIIKTSLAKYLMTWEQLPDIVSKGREYNFKYFMTLIKNKKIEYKVDEKYFKETIAKAILFKECDRIVRKLDFGGYKANIVTYSIAMLSVITNKRVDFIKIWDGQGLSKSMEKALEIIAIEVFKHITNPVKEGTNISEWCKKKECWDLFKDKKIDIPQVEVILEKQRGFEIGEKNKEVKKYIKLVKSVDAETWILIAKWAKETGKLDSNKILLIIAVGIALQRNKNINEEQARRVWEIYKEVINIGFNFESFSEKSS